MICILQGTTTLSQPHLLNVEILFSLWLSWCFVWSSDCGHIACLGRIWLCVLSPTEIRDTLSIHYLCLGTHNWSLIYFGFSVFQRGFFLLCYNLVCSESHLESSVVVRLVRLCLRWDSASLSTSKHTVGGSAFGLRGFCNLKWFCLCVHQQWKQRSLSPRLIQVGLPIFFGYFSLLSYINNFHSVCITLHLRGARSCFT